MNNPLGVSPSKGNQGTTRGKEKIFWPRWESNPVTGLARLPGRILLFFHMRNFSPADRDEIQETKPGGHILVSFSALVGLLWDLKSPKVALSRLKSPKVLRSQSRPSRSLVNSCNFTYKANMHTPKVEIHTRRKLCQFGCYVAKAKLFCLKSFVPVTRAGVFLWENFSIPVIKISVSGPGTRFSKDPVAYNKRALYHILKSKSQEE